ncbi:MAG: FAD-dependent oxidoreductase [Armatimonadetes bacterium]|nr:FAD-dependent oxidoreductase [Armatimonadota bacterium]
MKQILILGAGMSGLCAARQLKSAGFEPILVDKGRGVGGRMATRRFEGGTFDHGAQFFTARSEEFRALVEEWRESNIAVEWFAGYPSPQNDKPSDAHPRFRGESGMTGIAKWLARDLTVHLGEEIERLSFQNGRWTAFSRSGNSFEGDELLLTAPVPQSLTLLRNSGIELRESLQNTLGSLSYEPCFAVMANLDGPSQIPPPGALYVNGETVWWLADNFQKGISPREGSVTVHSSGAWATAHYEEPQNEVGAALLEAAAPFLGAPVESFEVRRWRYSKPENPVEMGSFRLRSINLSFAGDIFQGAKIEGAALSGLAAARKLIS